VKNCPDGSVEAAFEGEKASVNQAIEWCRQGPSASRVTEVTVNWQAFTGEDVGFEVRR
jgi:acylphosphatase